MSPAVHLIISLLIAFSLEIMSSRKYTTVFLLGLIGVFPDIDHFLPTVNGFKLFHNSLFMGVFPLTLLIFAQLVETRKNSNSSFYQRFFIGAMVVLIGHLLLDMIAGNSIQLGLFPNSGMITIPDSILYKSPSFGVILTVADLLWGALFAMTLSGNFVVAKIYGISEGWTDNDERTDDAQWAHSAQENIISEPYRTRS